MTPDELRAIRQRDEDVPWTAALAPLHVADEYVWTALRDRRALLHELDRLGGEPGIDDGTRRGERCPERNGSFWCSRDAEHPGAHESRADDGPGLIAWRNSARPVETRDQEKEAR